METTWREPSQGPPRRYYRLTADGRAALEGFSEQWRRFTDTVDAVLAGAHAGAHTGAGSEADPEAESEPAAFEGSTP